MKTTTKFGLIIAMGLFISNNGFARHGGTEGYLSALGARGGPLYGITYKHFFAPYNAIEIIAGSEWNGYSLTGLYEFEKEFKAVNGLYWFIGAGLNAGVYQKKYYFIEKQYATDLSTIEAAGVDAIVGLEYKISVIPLCISLDIKPIYNFYNVNQATYDFALSLRYILK